MSTQATCQTWRALERILPGLRTARRCRMRRHRINRNFTKPEAIQPLIFFTSSFEQVVKALNISPKEYESSLELKEWVRRNKDHKYVPTGLWRHLDFGCFRWALKRKRITTHPNRPSRPHPGGRTWRANGVHYDGTVSAWKAAR